MGRSRSKDFEKADASRRKFFSVLGHGGNALFKIAVAAAFVLLLSLGCRKAYQFGYQVFTEGTAEEAPGRNIEFTVLEGMSEKNVGTLLEKAGLVRNSRIFWIQAKIYGYELLPGSYTLNTSQTIRDMLLQMSGTGSGS